MGGLNVYMTPLGSAADEAMDQAWIQLTHERKATAATLTVLGRQLLVPKAARGVCRFTFAELCEQPLAAADYLAIAHNFHTVMIDRIPQMGPAQRNEARRFVVLIDTLYDEAVKLVCSAAVPPEQLYTQGDGADVFRRTASRLIEMQTDDYLRRGHGVHVLAGAAAAG
jgi:cell division protein ZapE